MESSFVNGIPVVAEWFVVPEEVWASVDGDVVDYQDIKFPARSTEGSMGADFFSTVDVTLSPGETALIPTGICCEIQVGWGLFILPRSGLGFKFRLQLDNTVGVIDQDYYGNKDNFGHIMVKVTNDSREGKTVTIKKGDKFVQGIFLPFGIAKGDVSSSKRQGGFGSTGE